VEKRRPSHDLERFKRVCGSTATIGIALSAQMSAQRIGFNLDAVAATVRSLKRNMFYKSMTSFADHRQWQDVYHVPTPSGLTIYLKFTDDTLTEFVILSFKEK
jgi:motility quorum-sensing regulator/GCU-specific mRNA interferase toxin